MNNADIPDCIAQWQSKLTIISRNLMELAQAESTRQILARLQDPAQPYTGVTQARARQALEGRDTLWQVYLNLAGVVEEAINLHHRSNVFNITDKEVIKLLTSRTVQMPLVHVPLPQRGLLESGHQGELATPEEVLAAMQSAFAHTRDELHAIHQAQFHLAPRVEAIRHELQALARWAQSLASPLPQIELDTVAHIESDPLASSIELERLEALLATERKRIEGIEQERAEIRSTLEQGQAALDELRELSRRSAAASDETRLKIASPGTLQEALTEEVIASMQAWLATLQETVAAGRWFPARVGLAKWREAMNARIDAERHAYAHNRILLDERADLRGRFSALQVKAQAYAARGLVAGDTLQQLTRATGDILNARPLAIEMARRMVAAYEITLSTQIQKQGTP